MSDEHTVGPDLYEKLTESGLDVRTVGEILGGDPPQTEPRAAPMLLPTLDGYPVDFPEPGIYFGMDEETYHAVPALSASSVKKVASSPMLFWATSPWLNPAYAELKREQEEQRKAKGQDHFDIGHAYHARILEGREAFEARFVPAISRKDYPGALVTTDDIKAAFPEGIKPRGKTKREIFEHLQTLDATVQLWDDIKAEHEAANEGKCFIPASVFVQLELAAAMIERDPDLGPELIHGGYPEVSLFWFCPRTGVPMKARCDYLKLASIIDLKTVQNSKEQSIENVIRIDISNRRYAIQPSVYLEGVDEVRRLVRGHNGGCVYGNHEGADGVLDPKLAAWAMQWAEQRSDTEWIWLYQQKGIAPVTRGVRYPVRGSTRMEADNLVFVMKKRVRQFSEVFGLDPWMDRAPIYDLADEDLLPYALDI